MSAKFFLLAGSVAGLLGVALGAFGAHGVEKSLTAQALGIYKTAVQYQFYHSFALMLTGTLYLMCPKNTLFKGAGLAFIFGIVVFSGSLYLYTITNIKAYAMITPIGGVGFIAGWAVLAIAIYRGKFYK